MFIRAVAAGLLLSGAAYGQTLGNYSGTMSNGANISMTLTADPNTGAPQISSFGLSINGNCKPSGSTSQGWGFNPGADFSAKKVSFTTDPGYAYFYIGFTGKSVGDTVSGTIYAYTPVLAPFTGKPSKALFCYTGKLTYSMTLQPGAEFQARPAGHMNYRQ